MKNARAHHFFNLQRTGNKKFFMWPNDKILDWQYFNFRCRLRLVFEWFLFFRPFFLQLPFAELPCAPPLGYMKMFLFPVTWTFKSDACSQFLLYFSVSTNANHGLEYMTIFFNRQNLSPMKTDLNLLWKSKGEKWF